MNLLEAGALELAALVRQRAVSPVEVLEAHIARIEAVNPAINAVVIPRFDVARQEAKRAEERLMQNDAETLPPFFGVPCTIKEFFEFEGHPCTGGVWAQKDRIAQHTATVVERMRAAGAIIMGQTNVPEGGLWMETDCKVYGRTRNPWNLSRTPGGSSGGEGAIVAAAGSPLGLGADIGGSIRYPAAFCGTVGHKPSGRLVPTTGHFPAPDPALLPALCLGPLTRRVADLMPTLQVLAGPDGQCPVAQEFTLGDPSTVRLEDVTVYTIDPGRRPRFRAPMKQALLNCAHALEERGARIETLDLPELRYGVDIWGAFLASGTGSSYAEILSPDRSMSPLWELLKIPFGQSRHTAPALLMVLSERLAQWLPKRVQRMAELGRELQQRLHDTLGEKGVFLCPPYTRAAPRHGGPLLTPFDGACTCLFNVLELPVTVVPVGFDGAQLPLAMQIGARSGNDHLTIAVAAAIEEAFGGWSPATPPQPQLGPATSEA